MAKNGKCQGISPGKSNKSDGSTIQYYPLTTEVVLKLTSSELNLSKSELTVMCYFLAEDPFCDRWVTFGPNEAKAKLDISKATYDRIMRRLVDLKLLDHQVGTRNYHNLIPNPLRNDSPTNKANLPQDNCIRDNVSGRRIDSSMRFSGEGITSPMQFSDRRLGKESPEVSPGKASETSHTYTDLFKEQQTGQAVAFLKTEEVTEPENLDLIHQSEPEEFNERFPNDTPEKNNILTVHAEIPQMDQSTEREILQEIQKTGHFQLNNRLRQVVRQSTPEIVRAALDFTLDKIKKTSVVNPTAYLCKAIEERYSLPAETTGMNKNKEFGAWYNDLVHKGVLMPNRSMGPKTAKGVKTLTGELPEDYAVMPVATEEWISVTEFCRQNPQYSRERAA